MTFISIKVSMFSSFFGGIICRQGGFSLLLNEAANFLVICQLFLELGRD